MADQKEQKFEEALSRLEEIVELLDDGNLPLEELEARYTEGMKLSKFCQQRLGEVETRVELLRKNAEGEWTKEEFGDE